jgi:hypothetical protein
VSRARDVLDRVLDVAIVGIIGSLFLVTLAGAVDSCVADHRRAAPAVSR